MTIRDYWIYQKRQTEVPWAVYITKEYDKRKGIEAIEMEWTIYSENIENSAHSMSRVGVKESSIDGFANELAGDLTKVSTVDNEDYNQLKLEFERILLS